MIIDKIENIGLYKDIPQQAIDFVCNLDKGVSSGKTVLSSDMYANIEEYKTKPLSDTVFESHKKYIDIQILLSGYENIFVTGIENLSEKAPYSDERDIVFYSDDVSKYPKITLDSTNFVMLFPHEAHAPQSQYLNSQIVKKVVIKIKI